MEIHWMAYVMVTILSGSGIGAALSVLVCFLMYQTEPTARNMGIWTIPNALITDLTVTTAVLTVTLWVSLSALTVYHIRGKGNLVIKEYVLPALFRQATVPYILSHIPILSSAGAPTQSAVSLASLNEEKPGRISRVAVRITFSKSLMILCIAFAFVVMPSCSILTAYTSRQKGRLPKPHIDSKPNEALGYDRADLQLVNLIFGLLYGLGLSATCVTSALIQYEGDGTLSESRQICSPQMLSFLQLLRRVAAVGIVSGSDLAKVNEQSGGNAHDVADYVMPENGIVAYLNGKQIGSESISKFLGEDKLKELLNFVLKYLSEIDIPIKRGTFIEYRTGMLNFSPIGRNCSQEERLAFFEYDKVHNVRKKMVDALKEKFGERFGLQFSIGGQISIDCFPLGWDKTFCLRHLPPNAEVHFFGDRTEPGGNDHEIYSHPRCIGHRVTGPADTIRQVKEQFGI